MVIGPSSLALASAILAAEETAPSAGTPAAPPPPPPSACPVGEEVACVLELTGKARPAVPAVCTTGAWPLYLAFEQPERLSDSNGDGWWESVVRIRLDPARGCTCAEFRLSCEKEPSGFTVNVGDSPTNDGWGGDAGTTPIAAGAMISDRGLSVFTQVPVDRIASLRFPALAGRTLTFRVCDQVLTYELDRAPGEAQPLVGSVETLRLPRLFSLGRDSLPEGRASERGVDYDIFAAFNRVIHVRGGAPPRGARGRVSSAPAST